VSTWCYFHTRCWLYQRLDTPERCRSEPPDLTEVAANHRVACHYPDRVAAALGTAGPLAVQAPASAAPGSSELPVLGGA
jgi:hypothetical protein